MREDDETTDVGEEVYTGSILQRLARQCVNGWYNDPAVLSATRALEERDRREARPRVPTPSGESDDGFADELEECELGEGDNQPTAKKYRAEDDEMSEYTSEEEGEEGEEDEVEEEDGEESEGEEEGEEVRRLTPLWSPPHCSWTFSACFFCQQESDYFSAELRNRLDDRQLDSARFVVQNFIDGSGAVVANEMGLGKTLTALAVLEAVHLCNSEDKSLIVAPKSVCGGWRAEYEKHAKVLPSIDPRVVEKHTDAAVQAWQANGGVLVVGHDCFVDAVKGGFDWKADNIVTDEVHSRNEKTAARGDKVQKTGLREALASSRAYHLLLTGTPVPNRLSQLYHLLELAQPGWSDCDDLKAFTRLYDSVTEDDERSVRRLHVLRHMSSTAMIRYRWTAEDKMPAKEEYVLWLDTEEVPYLQVRGESVTAIHKVNKELHDVKLGILSKMLHALGTTPVLVFAQTTALLKAAHSAFPDSLLMTGQTQHRQVLVDSFQRGDKRIFFLSLGTGAVGLNLTRATAVIHLDCSWVPASTNQATARAWRTGQTQPVRVYHLICEKTVEKHIYEDFVVPKTRLALRLDGCKGAWTPVEVSHPRADVFVSGSFPQTNRMSPPTRR